jgi:PadR family transcriptional regulator, regulatory protein AphA
MSNKQLTPTSFAILGLLSIQPFTTYELAQQMDRTVSWFWPRAASMVYEAGGRGARHLAGLLHGQAA